jgi:hypothetical protein
MLTRLDPRIPIYVRPKTGRQKPWCPISDDKDVQWQLEEAEKNTIISMQSDEFNAEYSTNITKAVLLTGEDDSLQVSQSLSLTSLFARQVSHRFAPMQI